MPMLAMADAPLDKTHYPHSIVPQTGLKAIWQLPSTRPHHDPYAQKWSWLGE